MTCTASNADTAGHRGRTLRFRRVRNTTIVEKHIFRGAIAAAACAAMFTATPAAAQQALCAKRNVMKGHLARTYTKLPVTIGVAGSDNVVEVLVSRKDGSRKLLVTAPNGTSCIVDGGKKIQRTAPRPTNRISKRIPGRVW